MTVAEKISNKLAATYKRLGEVDVKSFSNDLVSLLCDIYDNRSKSAGSLDKWQKRGLKEAWALGLIVSETYANGLHYLLSNAGNDAARILMAD